MKPALLFALIMLAFDADAQVLSNPVTKYKPGFEFWTEGARVKCKLIKWVHVPEASIWLWKAEFSEDYGGSIGTVKAIGNMTEQVIDLATDKAFRYKGKIIYYGSEEDCISKQTPK